MLKNTISALRVSPPHLGHRRYNGGPAARWPSTLIHLYTEVFPKTADDAGTQYKNALIDREAISPKASARYDAIRAAIKVAFGKKSPNLVSFGITPNKDPEPLTSEQKTERVAKARATRVARHTMGPKQKKAIHGQPPPPAEPSSVASK